MNAEKVRVLVVDDHFVARFGVRAFIDAQEGFTVVGEVDDGDRVLEAYARLRPDVVLMDLRMGRIGGIDAIHLLKQADPNARILVLSTFETPKELKACFDQGAAGYVKKETGPDELLTALKTVAAGGRYLPAAVERLLVQEQAQAHLTHREQQLLELMALGLTNKQIAEQLGISANTVRVYTSDLFEKLGVANRTEAVTMAMARGLLSG